MTAIYPEAIPAQGNEIWIWTELLADPQAPTAAELNAGLRFECYLFSDGQLELTAETSKVEANSRVCDTESRERSGKTKWTLSEAKIVRHPQEPDTHNSNLVKAAMKNGTTGYLTKVEGLPSKTTSAVTAGDIANVVMNVQCINQIPTKQGDGESAEFAYTQVLDMVTNPVFDRPIV